jgi:hypothetical protein
VNEGIERTDDRRHDGGDRHDGDDSILDQWMRAASRGVEDPAFVRPEDADTVAYLQGAASPEQAARVQAALLTSESYRRDIVEAIRDAESLSTAEARAAFDAQVIRFEQRSPTIWERVTELFAPRQWPFALAAAGLALLVVTFSQRTQRAVSDWPVAVLTPLDWQRENFAPFEMRGRDESVPLVGATAEEAALLALRRSVVWSEGSFEIRSAPPEVEERGRPITICIRAMDEQCRDPVRVSVPADASNASLVVYVATLDEARPAELKLASFPLAGDRTAVEKRDQLRERSTLTVAYPTATGFAATAPVVVSSR